MVSAHNKRCARRWLMLGFGTGCCALRGFGALRQIHLAAKDGIVFDSEPERANIAFNHATGAVRHGRWRRYCPAPVRG
jgi:hypothetical protein